MELKLFPKPKKIEVKEGQYAVSVPLTIEVQEDLDLKNSVLTGALRRSFERVCQEGDVRFVKVDGLNDEGYKLSISENGINISYSSTKGAYYGVVTLGQILSESGEVLPFVEIEDEPSLKVRGYMLDISRGKVPTLDDLCGYVDNLARLKYNQLQLYVEGFSFAYPSFAEVWKDVTPITGEEVKYLDRYCKERGIELVPNQNCLGHMAAWLARDEYKHLAETDQGREIMGSYMPVSTLNSTDPESLELVTGMTDDMLPYFTSDKFNVNLDEPFELGTGKNKALAEEKGEAYLYMDYLKRLHKMVAERGKHMYMWGDILANHPETLSELPENITVLDWGYEACTPFEENAANLEKKNVPFILCPGTSTWTTLTGRTDNMLENIKNAANAAMAHGGEGILVTAWGDGGHLEYEPLSYNAIAHAASCAWGNTLVTEKETHDYLDRFVFEDKNNVTASIIAKLGRLNRFEEIPMVNMTIASISMSMGLLPVGVFSMILKNVVKDIEALAPSSSGILGGLLNNIKEYDFDGTMRSIAEIEEELIKSDIKNEKGRLIYNELQNTVRFTKFGNIVHHLNAHGEKISEEERCAFEKELVNIADEILEIHPKLWIERNKIHGVEESVANFKKIADAIRSK